MIKLTTETGSFYTFDDDLQRWSKNGDGVNTVWGISAVPEWQSKYSEVRAEGVHAFVDRCGESGRLPVIGECLYVYSMDLWYLSTPVVSIEVIDESTQE